jgi:arabinofuranosyltransferase
VSKKNKNKKIKKEGSLNSAINKKGDFSIEILLLLAAIAVFIYFLNEVGHIQDDAFITFRYVKNLNNGNGLVFNAGERVEGYTNFLWTVIFILPAFLKMDIVGFSQILSSFFGVLVIIAAFFISRSIDRNTTDKLNKKNPLVLFDLVPVLLLTFTGAFTYWASSGMETSFFIFLVLSGLYFYIKYHKSNRVNFFTPVFLALSTLTRPEGFLFFVIIYFHKIFFVIPDKKEKVAILKKIFSRKILLEVSIFILPVLIHVIFRLIYYGYLLPNTYYAKVNYDYSSFKDGMEYLVSFIQDYLLYGAILIIPLAFLLKRKYIFEISLFGSIIFIYSFYVVIIGGDVLALHRFWLILLPLIYIIWGMFLKELYTLNAEKKLLPGTQLVIILLTASAAIGAYNYLHSEDKINELREKETALVDQFRMQAEVINDLEQIYKRKLTIAVSTIGSLSYYTDAVVIDMLGLTDEYIAHNPENIPAISNDPDNPWKERRYNSSYIISRKPDYILFSTGSKPSAYAERALFTDNEFFYYYYIQFIPRPHRKHLYYYARKTVRQLELTNPEITSARISPDWVNDYVDFYQSYSLYLESKTPENFNLVEDNFKQIIKVAPPFFADTYRIMGDAYFNAGNINDAIRNYNKALSKDSLNVLSYLGLGRIYQNQNQVEKANYCAREMQIKGLVRQEFIGR